MSKHKLDGFGHVRRRIGWTIAASLPLFFLFASVDEVERGLIATFLTYIAVAAGQIGWRNRRQIWFWCVAGTMVLAALVQVFGIEWPRLDTGAGLVTLYAVGAINALMWFVLFMLAPLLARDKPLEAPIRCPVCGLPVEKGLVRCSHCGEWSPAPVPPWPVAITFTPVVLVVVALIAI
jgi:hypothetical protein